MRRFSYQVDVGVEAAQYNAAPLVGGGVLPQSSQDTTISSAALRAGYEIVPDYVGYIRVGGSLYDYWHATHNNSSTYRVNLGLQILPRHIIYGEAYVGYLVQNFAQSSLGSTSAPDYGGRLVWNVTRLTTLTFNGLRTFNTGTPRGQRRSPSPARPETAILRRPSWRTPITNSCATSCLTSMPPLKTTVSRASPGPIMSSAAARASDTW